jgi:hypothetical protein
MFITQSPKRCRLIITCVSSESAGEHVFYGLTVPPSQSPRLSLPRYKMM